MNSEPELSAARRAFWRGFCIGYRRGTLLGLALLAVYIGVAMAAFGFRHPELTDTQRLLRFWDAIAWK